MSQYQPVSYSLKHDYVYDIRLSFCRTGQVGDAQVKRLRSCRCSSWWCWQAVSVSDSAELWPIVSRQTADDARCWLSACSRTPSRPSVSVQTPAYIDHTRIMNTTSIRTPRRKVSFASPLSLQFTPQLTRHDNPIQTYIPSHLFHFHPLAGFCLKSMTDGWINLSHIIV